MPTELLSLLPTGYAKIGDIAILRLASELQDYKYIIGETILELLQVKVVVNQKDTKGEFRIPEIELLAGEKRTTTVHKEYNTKFFIDIAQLTFSPGNKQERRRLINIVEPGEHICDMFACIGNLSLPIAVNNPFVHVTAIEINPIAFQFLQKNIEANKVQDRYTAILGDNRTHTPTNCFNRVLMGGFNSDDTQFKNAVLAINHEGWIHYHTVLPRDRLLVAETYVFQKSKEYDFLIDHLETRVVKKYSPRKYHICVDLYIKKST